MQEGGLVVVYRRVGQEGSKVGAYERMPLQGPPYAAKEPAQGLLAAQVLVELEKPPDGRAGALLGVGDESRKADRDLGGRRASVWMMGRRR